MKSVLLNSEIVDIISSKGRQPTLDKEATVKILTFDNDQWVAYDDEDTLQMKADFARSQCLGGLMVWAVSHDTSDGKFSRALGRASGRKYVSALANTVDGPVSPSKHPQDVHITF
jgi:chitinase